MDFFLSHRPLWAIGVSMLMSIPILLSGRKPNLRETWTFLAALAKCALILSMLGAVRGGETFEITLLPLAPGIFFQFRVDELGLVFALVASFLWILTSVYSIGYLRGGKYKNQTGYFASFAVCLSAVTGLAFSANLLTFFIFYEILTLATYPLVVHNRTDEAIRAGRKYLFYTLVAGQCLLVAIIWTHFLTDDTTFRPGGFLPSSISPATLVFLFGLFVAGCGVKAAILPLHSWLPKAMVAPTPVSALLHAVAVVKAGVFGIVRIVGYVFGVDLLREIGVDLFLAGLAALTILYGSACALREQHLKRRLAFSTISQLSYIVLGCALGSAAAIAGAIFHLVAHAFLKITLFFCAGAIQVHTGRKHVLELKGIGRTMPITMAAFAVAATGLVGVPLLPAFISKWNLGLGSIAAGHGWFIAVLVASGLLNIAYFFPIIHDAFFHKADGELPPGEASSFLWIPLALTASIAVVLGIYPDAFWSFYELAWDATRSITGGAP